MATEPAVEQFGPPDRGGVLLGRTLPEVAVACVAFALAVPLLGQGGGGLVLALVFVLSGLALALLPIPAIGTTAVSAIPVVARYAWRPRTWLFRQPPSKLSGETVEAPPIPVPPPLEGIEILDHEGIGVVANRAEKRYSIVLHLDPRSFLLLGEDDQERLVRRWQAALAWVGRPDSPLDRLGWYERTVPDLADAMHAAFAADPEVNRRIGTPAWESYRRLLDKAAPLAQGHELFAVLRLDPAKARRQIKAVGKRVDPDVAAATVLYREAANFATQIGRPIGASGIGLAVRGALPPAQISQLLREAYDPAWRRVGRVVPEGTNAWASATTEATRTYRTDSAVHCTYTVARFPPEPVDVRFLAPLMVETNAARTVAFVLEPLPVSFTRKSLRSRRTSRRTDAKLRDRWELDEGDDSEDVDAHLARKGKAVSRGAVEAKLDAFVTVSARDADELDQACADVENAATLAGVILVPMVCRQAEAFTFSLPLCLGIPPQTLRAKMGM